MSSSQSPTAQAAAVPLPAEGEAPAIEVDSSHQDSSSEYGEELSTYSTSLSSSVKNYEWSNGRRYHAYRSGSYKFPNDEREQDRLDMTHHIIVSLCDGRRHFAPFKTQGARVLDIGTGTGIWCIDMGDEYPEAEVILGNDLSPIQPSWVPPNVRFVVDDVENDWVVEEPYDFIHCRYMCASISDWPRLMRQCFENLRPGGWIEVKDYHAILASDDGSVPPNSIFNETWGLLAEAMGKVNREVNTGPKLEGWVKDAGFVNVHHTMIKLPVGTWPKDPKMKEMGAFGLLNILEAVDAALLGPFTQILGWKKEEVDVLCAKVRTEVRDKKMHGYHPYHIVWAQKPE